MHDLQKRGILHRMEPIKHYKYTFPHHTFHDVYLKTSDNQTFCRGTSTDMMEAYAKALGEVFERTSLRYPPRSGVTLASSNQLKSKGLSYVDPLSFAQATEEQKRQFPQFSITADDVFAWISGSEEGTTETLLPLQTVYFGTHTAYKEKSIIQQSTHGAGASFDVRGAHRSGLLEIMHRHFFLKSWYFDTSVSVVDVHSIPKELHVASLISDFMERNFEVTFLTYSHEVGLPTVICLLNKNGGTFCGGSTALTLEGALQRSLSEAFATYLWVQQSTIRGEHSITSHLISESLGDFIDTKATAHRRVYLFSNSYFCERQIIPILENKKTVSFETAHDKESEYDCVQHAKRFFPNLYSYNVKNELLDVYQYYVSRVVVPQSYFFALDEHFSRPVLTGTSFPHYREINPFP